MRYINSLEVSLFIQYLEAEIYNSLFEIQFRGEQRTNEYESPNPLINTAMFT